MVAASSHISAQHLQRKRQWTASTCGRLMRPLQTALASLEKARKHGLGSTTADSVVSTLEQDKSDSDDSDDDAWASFNSRRRNKITYKSRSTVLADTAETSMHSMTPARNTKPPALPTPFVDRLRDPDADETILSYVTETPAHPVKVHLPSKAPRLAAFSARCAEEVALDAFKTLLESTCRREPTETGAPSLLSTSLRSIPKYIEQEAHSRKLVDRDDRSDVAAEAYEWLEDVSQLTGRGEDCLRETVRAHGISLVCNAIRNRLLGSDLVQEASTWCSTNAATDACRAIISALIQSEQPPKVPARSLRAIGGISYQTSPAFTLIADAARASGLNTSSTTHMKTLLISQTIPVFALPCKDAVYHRTMAIRTVILRGRYAPDALDLLETILLCSCGVDPHPPEQSSSADPRFLRLQESTCKPALDERKAELLRGLHTNIAEFCTILVSMAHIGHYTRGHGDQRTVIYDGPLRALRGAALSIMRTYTSVGLLEKALAYGLGHVICTVLMSDLIVVMGDLEPFIRHIPRPTSVQQRLSFIARICTVWRAQDETLRVLTSALSGLVRDIGVTCEEHRRGNGFELVRSLTRQLIAHEAENSMQSLACKQIALDAALSFAQSTELSHHAAFARTLEKSVSLERPAARPLETPRANKGSQLRWEEGLCEWVVATPAPLRTQDFESRHSPPVAEKGDDERIESPDVWDELSLISPEKENRQKPRDVSVFKKPTPTGFEDLHFRKGQNKAGKAIKRRFIDFLVNDNDYTDELSLEAATPLADITNFRHVKLRRTM